MFLEAAGNNNEICRTLAAVILKFLMIIVSIVIYLTSAETGRRI